MAPQHELHNQEQRNPAVQEDAHAGRMQASMLFLLLNSSPLITCNASRAGTAPSPLPKCVSATSLKGLERVREVVHCVCQTVCWACVAIVTLQQSFACMLRKRVVLHWQGSFPLMHRSGRRGGSRY